MTGENGTPPTAEEIPDLIGREGRANTVAGLLRQVQIRLFHLEAEQVANGLADTDPAPGFAEKTVAELRNELRENQDRITEVYADLMPDVLAMLGEEREGG